MRDTSSPAADLGALLGDAVGDITEENDEEFAGFFTAVEAGAGKDVDPRAAPRALCQSESDR